MVWPLIFCLCLWSLAESAPLQRKLVGLSYAFDDDTLYHPMHKKFNMTVLFNGTYDDTFWLQIEEYASTTHTGTHIDAPSHFAKGGWTVDEVPLSRLIAPAAVVDVTEAAAINRDYEVTIEDLVEWEERTEQLLNDVILLIRSGWGQRWHDRELFTGTAELDLTKLHFPGLKPDAAQWLVDNRNIYGIGIDTLSFDHGPSTEFMVHRTLLGRNIYGMENVANLEKLPLYGAMLYVMPMNIARASGAPARIVATIPEVIYSARRDTTSAV